VEVRVDPVPHDAGGRLHRRAVEPQPGIMYRSLDGLKKCGKTKITLQSLAVR
jgi:hypothetical protein